MSAMPKAGTNWLLKVIFWPGMAWSVSGAAARRWPWHLCFAI
jgi:hypothetical protein